ncbi:MAG: hypothetical protein FWG34_11160 [Oscillospiraceae bacterium]|nr:hypothetical protein [Oscillospiraceae bacterium]
MELLYKPDWDKTKDNYSHWWAREDFGRCAISIRAPRAKPFGGQAPALPEKIEDRWLDIEYLKKSAEHRFGSTYYAGEAFPLWNAGYPGWDFIPSYIGCDVELAEHTGWVSPLIQKGELTEYKPENIKIGENNKWHKFALKIHNLAASEAKGKSIPGIQAIGGVGDIMAALRGTQELLYDLYDCPEHVKKMEMRLMDIWTEVFERFYNITREAAEGTTNFMGIWAPSKFYTCSNDFSYSISTKMFEEIFMDALQKQVDYLDYSIYHVDGIGAFKHIDMLCGIKKLNALQFLPGAGKPSPLHYKNELKKIQAAGKNLHISIAPQEVKQALDMLSSKGLFIDTWCGSEGEADDLLKCAGQWSKWD